MIENCIIHNTAVSYDKNPDQWNATNEYHKKKWNFKSSLGFYVGYHYEIAKDGTVRQARKDNEQAAHTIGYNHNSIGIVLDGNFENEFPTKEQTVSLKKLVTRLNKLYNFKKIGGHRDFDNRICPGKNITDSYIKSLTKSDMEFVIQSGEQYIRYTEPFKIAFNLADEPQLEKFKEKGLRGTPMEVTDIKDYMIFPLVDKKDLAVIIKKLKDKFGF